MLQIDVTDGTEMEITAGIEITGEMAPRFEEILTPAAQHFIAGLERRFGAERKRLIAERADFQARLDEGENPRFLPATSDIRAGDWRVAKIPEDLQDRRVEITGPVERKMVINALNSGAHMFMADFEDSAAPTWDLMINGQINLSDAVRREIAFSDPNSGKDYALGDDIATLIVRPRGWHLEEAHIIVDGAPASAALVDFGLFLYHNASELLARGSGPYFYLPKMENHHEARLWNDVFVHAQQVLGLAPGTIKATVLIETITAAFEMDEILYELRDHIAGLNCGRWDYIFSVIKKFRNRADMVLPDRGDVGMTQPLMRAYSRLLIQTCHRRGAHAMGGMAAQIPIKGDSAANDAATAKVRGDKEREAGDGHDGTWVAHPGQVAVAMEVFDRLMPEANQTGRTLDNLVITEGDLLQVPRGKITEAGLRGNISVGIQYIESWLRGQGCVPLYNLMEDAATAEISRAQVWQWLKHGARLDDGRVIDRALFDQLLSEETAGLEQELGEERFAGGRFADAITLFAKLSTADDFEEFLTLPAYRLLADGEARAG
ncbi:MAG: malate synthase A [Alphaproteobacteria bacterium]|jgi:malate synthase|nr:malate synthase A [Alphaproteobacteria bacterium]